MWSVLWGVLSSFLVWAFPRILAALGIYYVSSAVSIPIYTYLKTMMTAQIGTLGPDFLNAFYLSGLYDAIFIIMSAYTLALGIKGLKAIGKIPAP